MTRTRTRVAPSLFKNTESDGRIWYEFIDNRTGDHVFTSLAAAKRYAAKHHGVEEDAPMKRTRTRKKRTTSSERRPRARKRRRSNPEGDIGEALMYVTIGAVAGGVLGGLAKSPATASNEFATVSGVLAGAASGAGLVAVVGLIGALFDAEAGLLTAGLGLGAAVLLGIGANLTSNVPVLPAASTTSA